MARLLDLGSVHSKYCFKEVNTSTNSETEYEINWSDSKDFCFRFNSQNVLC